MTVIIKEILPNKESLPALTTLGLGANKVDDNERWTEIVEGLSSTRPEIHVLWEPK